MKGGKKLIISIASGKGGTGKTTIATNLALALGDVQLLDCDVEEPNSHIFLDMKLEKDKDVFVTIPKFDKAKCDFCKKCSEFCQYNAIAVMPKDVLFFQELCHGCGGCKLVCPNDAITEEKRSIGIIERGVHTNIEFYHGLLNIGELMASAIISELKEKIDKNRIAIIDSPPGTACPVIESIVGSDYCILVTEPTPFGLHDLKLAVEVARELEVDFGVIINRDGIGNDEVEKYCKNEEIPILMKIPQSEEIAKLYSKGIPYVNEIEGYKEKFIELFDKIKEGGSK